MKVYKLVFSPTGGTDKAASLLAGALDAQVETVDLSAKDFAGCDVPGDSVAVIAAPSFGGRAPQVAIDRLKQIRGNGAKAVVMAVYGNRAQEDTLLELADTAKTCGFEVVAGIAAVAEHSIAHQYAAGRPDEADARQLRDFAQAIREKLAGGGAAPELPGDRPYKKPGAGLVPSASAACVSCGLCAAKCPVGAIDKDQPRKTDKKICVNCMRCAAICPQGARRASPLMVKAVGVALKKPCGQRKKNELYI